MDDTIAAISTPVGEGGIAIIRVSGPRAFEVADALFRCRNGKPSEFPTHTIHFGVIVAGSDTVDQVMLTVMRSPRTYTKEDTIEINCHGGYFSARKILSLCLTGGARLAEPGEFTKRAFLNGRIDLTQAEGVMDLIRARTERAHAVAVRELQGHLSIKINQAREQLVDILANVEAHIDFPEEDIAPETRNHLMEKTSALLEALKSILATAREGKILRNGIAVAIVGRPNVGKSSLLNALLGEDRAIVTPIAGTTRDTVEESVSIDGVMFRFTDTAGIRKSRNSIEAIGIERSHNALDDSEIVVHLMDASRPFNSADLDILDRSKEKIRVLVLNKIDLPIRLTLPSDLTRHLRVSAHTGVGLPELSRELVDLAYRGTTGVAADGVAINERQAVLLASSLFSLTDAYDMLNRRIDFEIVAQQFRLALDSIGEIIGKTTREDILARVFSMFCIGK